MGTGILSKGNISPHFGIAMYPEEAAGDRFGR